MVPLLCPRNWMTFTMATYMVPLLWPHNYQNYVAMVNLVINSDNYMAIVRTPSDNSVAIVAK